MGEGAPVAEEPGEAVDAPTPQPAAADAPEPTLAAPNIPAPDPGPVVDEPIAATQSAIADPAGVPDTPEADPPPITSEQPPLATAPVAGVLAVWARDCAALRALPPPPGFTRWRWRRVGDEAGMFVDRWGAEAIRLGWTVHDVFGAHDGAPTQRRDCMGLVVLLGDSSIVAIDPHGADVVTAGGARQRFRRRPMPIGTVTLAELARRWQLPSAEAA